MRCAAEHAPLSNVSKSENEQAGHRADTLVYLLASLDSVTVVVTMTTDCYLVLSEAMRANNFHLATPTTSTHPPLHYLVNGLTISLSGRHLQRAGLQHANNFPLCITMSSDCKYVNSNRSDNTDSRDIP